MSGAGDNEQGAAKLPRVESVIADGPPDLAEHYRAFGVAADSFDVAVELLGRNLGELFSAIREQKAAWVCEADRPTAELVSPGTAVVESIAMVPTRDRTYGGF